MALHLSYCKRSNSSQGVRSPGSTPRLPQTDVPASFRDLRDRPHSWGNKAIGAGIVCGCFQGVCPVGLKPPCVMCFASWRFAGRSPLCVEHRPLPRNCPPLLLPCHLQRHPSDAALLRHRRPGALDQGALSVAAPGSRTLPGHVLAHQLLRAPSQELRRRLDVREFCVIYWKTSGSSASSC